MDVLIVIGDQDTYHEREADVVSSPIWVADILSDEGLRGLFVLHARRAEILAAEGRVDVIRALRRHEIGLHGRDVHPVIPEIVEDRGWHDGVEALLAVEGAELDLLARVFEEEPVCSSQHRNHAAPQIFGVARRLGMPYLFGFPAAPPLHSVSWYAGALNVPFNAPVPDFLGFFPAVFDDALSDDVAFADLFARLQRHVERCREVGLPLLVVFVCHPERLCYTGPIEQWQYGNGRNHDPASVPPDVEKRRSRSETDRALVNLRSLVRYLRDAPGLEPTTVREVARVYGTQVETISRGELADLAATSVGQGRIPIGARVSAAELLVGFAESMARFGRDGHLPSMVARRDVLGPTESSPLAPEVSRVELARLATIADDLLAIVKETGFLPASLAIDGRTVGLGSLYGAFATAYLRIARGEGAADATGVALDAWPRYPEPAVALGEQYRLCVEDPLVRPGLSTEAIAHHARLQTWTLKPARRAGQAI